MLKVQEKKRGHLSATEKYSDQIDMMALLRAIGPLKRTLACSDTDKALEIVRTFIPDSQIEGFSTGKKVWSWTIPHRWELKKATIRAKGKTLVDAESHHLHVVNYSQPFKGILKHDELLKKLHSDPAQPQAIPFRNHFYRSDWGFCIPHAWRDRFNASEYEVEIDSEFIQGDLNVLTSFLPGDSEKIFILCSNICHPMQVNDSLTGVAVFVDVMRRLRLRAKRKYSYLFLLVPESIGSIAYLSHHPELIPKCVGGMFSEMLGTSGPLVMQKTRKGESYWDIALQESLNMSEVDRKVVPFFKSAGNDEKILDSPGVDIPTLSLTRHPYPEYHTSEDNIELIDINKLREARDVIQTFFDMIEDDYIPVLNQPGPIFLSGYDLYPNWEEDPSKFPVWLSFLDIMYSIDGRRSLLEIANNVKRPYSHVKDWCDSFSNKALLIKRVYSVLARNV